MNLIDLYSYVEQHNIDIDWFSMQRAKSLSVPLPNGKYGIAVDPWKVKDIQEELCCIAHEAGHCITGSFYNKYAACDVRQKHENRADKWAIKRLVPASELDEALSEGHTEIWDLAEYFGVTEDFMRKAVCWYTHGNLAVDAYF